MTIRQPLVTQVPGPRLSSITGPPQPSGGRGRGAHRPSLPV